MMSLRVKLSAEEFAAELEGEILERAKAAVGRAADRVVTGIKSKLSRPYAGEAAAPGEAPRRRTGELAEAVHRTPVEVTGGRNVWCRVVVDHPGAGALEFGSVEARRGLFSGVDLTREQRNRVVGYLAAAGSGGALVRRLPHPFLRPTLEEEAPALEAQLKQELGG